MDILADPNSPNINHKILQHILKDKKKFGKFVCAEFTNDAKYAAVVPRYSDDLMLHAYQSYLRDIKRLGNNMDPNPNHFEICGYLAYWLCRNSPVVSWNKGDDVSRYEMNQDMIKAQDLIFESGRSFHAFMIGYRICWFFERHKEEVLSQAKSLPELNEDYIRAICHVMQYKDISPHAMGLIYRSLFLGC